MSWVVFDIFGVLITEGHIIHHGFLPLLKDPPSEADVKRAYELYTNGEIATEEFWQRLNATPELEEKYLAQFKLDPDEHTVLHELKNKGVKIGVISNVTRPWFEALSKQLELDTLADFIDISADAHVSKPDRKIFDIFLEQTGADPASCLFVDDKKENLASAASDGFRTCWFKREEDTHAFEPDHTITHLQELLDLV